jgi:hypothetical protein
VDEAMVSTRQTDFTAKQSKLASVVASVVGKPRGPKELKTVDDVTEDVSAMANSVHPGAMEQLDREFKSVEACLADVSCVDTVRTRSLFVIKFPSSRFTNL